MHSSPVSIFWDFENCAVGATAPVVDIVRTIQAIARKYGTLEHFRAYSDHANLINSESLRSNLMLSGVTLVDCPHNKCKNVVDSMLIVDMIQYTIPLPTPATVILISGDRDYAYAVSVLCARGYDVILIASPTAHESLKSLATESLDWNTDVLKKPSHIRAQSADATVMNSQQDAIPKPPPATRTRRAQSESSNPPILKLTPRAMTRTLLDPMDEIQLNELRTGDNELSASSYGTPVSPSTSALPSAPVIDSRRASVTFTPKTRSRQNSLLKPVVPLPNQTDAATSLSPQTENPNHSSLDTTSETLTQPARVVIREATPPVGLPVQEIPPFGTNFKLAEPKPESAMSDRLMNNFKNYSFPSSSQSSSLNMSTVVSSILEPDISQISTSPITDSVLQRPIPGEFARLIDILDKARIAGEETYTRTKLGTILDIRIYQLAGCTKFKTYCALAEKENVIVCGGVSETSWVALHPSWYGRGRDTSVSDASS